MTEQEWTASFVGFVQSGLTPTEARKAAYKETGWNPITKQADPVQVYAPAPKPVPPPPPPPPPQAVEPPEAKPPALGKFSVGGIVNAVVGTARVLSGDYTGAVQAVKGVTQLAGSDGGTSNPVPAVPQVFAPTTQGDVARATYGPPVAAAPAPRVAPVRPASRSQARRPTYPNPNALPVESIPLPWKCCSKRCR